jgi:hypothetical protein
MTLADIKSEAQALITTDNVPGSLEFAEKLEKSLNENNIKDSNAEAYRELSKIIFQLYVTAIPNISTELFHKIISLNIIEALTPLWPSERDFAARIESRYSIYPVELIKEEMRKDLLPLLKQNSQLIGSVVLRLSQENPQAKPSIANWIEYYDRTTGLGSSNSFQRSRFISGDPIVQTLNSEEKESLRKVIQFYDYLQTDETVLYQDIYNTTNTAPQTNLNTISPTIPAQPVNPNPIPTPQSDITVPIPAPNNIPQPAIPRTPIPRRISAPVVLTAKPTPIPQNLVNLKKPE